LKKVYDSKKPTTVLSITLEFWILKIFEK